jgi:hypothetical protein
MHVDGSTPSTRGTSTNNTATVPTASEQEKENGSEKKELLIPITDKTRSTVRNDGGNAIPITGENTGKRKKAHRHHLNRQLQRWTGHPHISSLFQENAYAFLFLERISRWTRSRPQSSLFQPVAILQKTTS